MFETLIARVEDVARAIQALGQLPPSCGSIGDDMRVFDHEIAPALRSLSGNVGTFAQHAETTATAMLAKMVDGKTFAGFHDQAIAMLLALSARANGVLQSDKATFSRLDSFRRKLTTDELGARKEMTSLSAQASSLRQQLDSKRHDLEKQEQTLRYLRLSPWSWAGGELYSLIKSHKTFEQQISDLGHQSAEMDGQLHVMQGVMNAIDHVVGAVDLVNNASQSMLNTISATSGQILQITSALGSGQDASQFILVKAYVATLDNDARALADYVGAG